MRKLFLAFFLFAIPAQGQAIQSKVCLRNQFTNFAAQCKFDRLLTSGDMAVAATFGGCGSGTCNPVSDSQANIWQVALAVPYYNGAVLLYALDVKGGADTVSFGSNGAWLGIIAEYPPSYGLDAAGYHTYADSNLDAKPGDSNDLGWAGPIETKESGELIIAWGFNGALNPCCGVMQAGPGFTVRGIAEGGFVMEDSWTAGPGLYIASVEFPGYAHWNFGMAAFKMKKGTPQ